MRPPRLDDGDVVLYVGDCIEVMAEMDEGSVDAVVCDPPYGLEFMGKEWDSFAPVDLDRGGRWTKDVRGAPGTIDNSDKRTPHGRTGVSFGAARTFTSKCDGCGKRDAFRAVHGCDAGWSRVVVDEGPPPRMVAFAAWCETWAREALRVLKPGGHLLAFGGTRTFHRLTVGIEDAGFEIRDTISWNGTPLPPVLQWVYGSGFPKSLDVSKAIDRAAGAEREVVGVRSYPTQPNGRSGLHQGYAPGQMSGTEVNNLVTAPATDAAREWQGWGTALKPGWEPCVVARKPLAGTVAENVQQHGTGAINIDGCRIGSEGGTTKGNPPKGESNGIYGDGINGACDIVPLNAGRWPANVAFDEEAAAMLDAQSGERGAVAPASGPTHDGPSKSGSMAGPFGGMGGRAPQFHADTGGASRFFYTAKASRADRSTNGANNTHPTVKPTDVMRWLVRLVTPPGGVVLDPFAGSGSTLVAARAEGVRSIGIEREDEYAEIIAARLSQLSLFSEAS
jgi:DNA modification methylase